MGLALLGAVLAGAFFLAPVPLLYVYLPGPVRDVRGLVEVSNARTYSSEGPLYLTTVSVDVHATPLDLLYAALDPHREIVPAQEVTGGLSPQRLKRQQRQQMSLSKQHAKEVALTALGFGAPEGDGARVTETLSGAPADGLIEPGDVIEAIDGRPVDTTCDVGEHINSVPIGDEVDLSVRRDGALETVAVQTAASPLDATSAFIGIVMEDVGYSFSPRVEVDFETGRIAGPSAGLMFTLALYDRLTPDDLTGGRTIAGTGTIDCGGRVGPIGGIEQKVVAAERRGAEVFLAPAANAPGARATADDIEVVAVSNFSDAVDYLEGAH